jgi:SAM-dependent MidA family methyltransferase
LSVDVDFSLIKETVSSDEQFVFHGPLTQREFLTRMGISARVMMLLQKARGEQKNDLISGYERLINDMGTVYKVCAITSSNQAPYPFESKVIDDKSKTESQEATAESQDAKTESQQQPQTDKS